MIRKSLFWGLTLVLVVALVSLIIRGRQMEKQQSARPVEVVRQSQSSPTRVLHPDDLQVVSSTMQFDNRHAALHEIEIRNNGVVSYSGIQLSFIYLDKSGKVRFTTTHSLGSVAILSGQGYTATNVTIAQVPASATKFQVSIICADMLSPNPATTDRP